MDSRSKMLEEERYLDEKESIRQRSADRRAERKAKSDEIKRKYGDYILQLLYTFLPSLSLSTLACVVLL